ncbi:hypothetical protein [Lyngbya aestuarii]|uniref:hypothetical protein n=1 Tax=Lyngbya aestuarii TaxID=118322 RepID=UPI00403DCC2D
MKSMSLGDYQILALLNLPSSNCNYFMESTGSSANSSEPHPHRWAEVIGTVIALLTLTLPLCVIAYYSSSSSLDVWEQTNYPLPRPED